MCCVVVIFRWALSNDAQAFGDFKFLWYPPSGKISFYTVWHQDIPLSIKAWQWNWCNDEHEKYIFIEATVFVVFVCIHFFLSIRIFHFNLSYQVLTISFMIYNLYTQVQSCPILIIQNFFSLILPYILS